jgi:methylated-DNA-[protein]-cysteine S-methyltransferase
MRGVSVWTSFTVDDETTLALVAGEQGVEQIRLEGTPPDGVRRDDAFPALVEAVKQLEAYFARELKVFELILDPRGTPFQQRVWQELLTIPHGKTRSYSEVAVAIGAPKAVRAVGAANGQNPIPIVIPCHRVIGASGKLVGFGGGLPLKRKLLDLESGQMPFTRDYFRESIMSL